MDIPRLLATKLLHPGTELASFAQKSSCLARELASFAQKAPCCPEIGFVRAEGDSSDSGIGFVRAKWVVDLGLGSIAQKRAARVGNLGSFGEAYLTAKIGFVCSKQVDRPEIGFVRAQRLFNSDIGFVRAKDVVLLGNWLRSRKRRCASRKLASFAQSVPSKHFSYRATPAHSTHLPKSGLRIRVIEMVDDRVGAQYPLSQYRIITCTEMPRRESVEEKLKFDRAISFA